MIIVQDCIISDDIADQCFSCELSQCKGQCCVEGDYGAPLDPDEVSLLERALPLVKPYMTPEGIAVVEREGVSVPDNDDEPSTPLVGGCECAFVSWAPDGTALCAVERAFRDHKIDFLKPVSCHLYPLRVDDYGDFRTVNYHRWDVCHCAVEHGNEVGIPLYRYLKEPLIRKFGIAWYEELVQTIEEKFSR